MGIEEKEVQAKIIGNIVVQNRDSFFLMETENCREGERNIK
jgi:hypothetical protein